MKRDLEIKMSRQLEIDIIAKNLSKKESELQSIKTEHDKIIKFLFFLLKPLLLRL